jgi:hypothetical protein
LFAWKFIGISCIDQKTTKKFLTKNTKKIIVSQKIVNSESKKQKKEKI